MTSIRYALRVLLFLVAGQYSCRIFCSSQLLECGAIPALFDQGGSAGSTDEIAGIVNEIRVQAERASSRVAERELAHALRSPDSLVEHC